MDLDGAMNAAMESWFSEEVTDPILYNGKPVRGHITYGGRGAKNSRHAALTVKVEDVPDPQYRDAVVINGTEWRVFQDEANEVTTQGDGYTWEIPLFRDEKVKAW